MTTPSRTVRVFLSSTFRDFAEERDLLVRKIFPELRRKCRERQVELVDVDLRWGITEEEAQQGKVLPICLAEIDRSRPFFMGFIGDRYGWVPEKDQYDLSLIMEQSWLDTHRGGKSVTELEMLHGVLNNPAMEDRAFFYFRDSAYSQAKGGAYLSEGPQEKAKLEALKDRIRHSGFPIVENYRSPEELAELVRDDLWKLIDEAFPESEVPDALARERMRHEAFTASRLSLYIGGEPYFGQIDSAMIAETRRPVLVTGDSGGGKSALLANWASRFSQNNPSAIFLTHCLATGADAAQPVNMAVRILREISRITGEELVLEGDPRKALHMLAPWLARAGAFAIQNGGVFALVLDGLDKMDAQHEMGWWPSMLPEGVGLVASCLSGKVFDHISSRMDWEKLPVSPLKREDCETFIASHLGKYRKSLTPELTSKVVSHPLSGNPLFLRTLLEELRVFGVHEELGPKLDHYLSSLTVDDLFERVLERVESDNSPESVRAVLEVLWAAKESFAEDELLAVSGLPPAVWAQIHIALDESLIGAGGRLAFSHDYLRKAVEDRYLPSAEDRRRIQIRMAEFCAQAMAEGRKGISNYVRRHAVEHFLGVEDWDNATAALSDLEFIEARAIAQELPAMLTDYAEAVKLLPEGEKERQTEAARQAELDRYAREMDEYAATWARIRESSGEPEPILPRPVKSVRLWTQEEIATERKRMTDTPNRLDIVKAFRVFIATNSAPLQKYCIQEGFAANLARNEASAGPVHQKGRLQLNPLGCVKLIKQYPPDESYSPLPACKSILEGHESGIRILLLTIDGSSIISGSTDSYIRIWDILTGECLKVLAGHEKGISCLVLSLDGQLVFSGSHDNTIRVWDIMKGECLKVLAGHESYINSLKLCSENRICSASSDNTLRIWDIETGECLKVLSAHSDLISSLVLSADGCRIFSGSRDKTIRVWDIQTGQCLNVLQGHDGMVSSIVLTADWQQIISSSSDKTLRLWNTQTGECVKAFEGHEGEITSLVLTADERFIISGSYDNTIRIWDIHTGECLKVLQGHKDCISWDGVGLNSDGELIISGSDDRTLRVWDIQTGECLKVLEGHNAGISSFVIGSDGNLFSGSEDGTIRVWDIVSGECLKVADRHRASVSTLVLSANGRHIFSSSKIDLNSGIKDPALRIWDAETGKCIVIIDEHGDSLSLSYLALSPDGRHLVAGGSNEANLRLWEIHPDNCIRILHSRILDREKSISCLALSPDSRRIISGNNDRRLRVWDIDTGKCIHVLDGHKSPVSLALVSADGQRIFSGSWENTIRVWDMISGKCLNVLEGHAGRVLSLVLSSNNCLLASCSRDKTIRVWDLIYDKCPVILDGHKDTVSSLAFSADGRRLFSASDDNTIRVWDIISGECIKAFEVQNEIFMLSPDGCYIASRTQSSTFRIWSIDSGKLECEFFLRGFSVVAMDWAHRRLSAGFCNGQIRVFHLENLPLGPFITTSDREILSEGLHAGPVTARPPCCGQKISISNSIADRIEHWTRYGGEGGYTDPALLLDCPNCHTPLRMNPFFVDITQTNN